MFSQFFEIKKISSKANLPQGSNPTVAQKGVLRSDNNILGQANHSKVSKPRESVNLKKLPHNVLPLCAQQDLLKNKKVAKTQLEESSLAKYLQIRSQRAIAEPSTPHLNALPSKEKQVQKSGLGLNPASPRARVLTQSPSSKLKTTFKNIETKNLWPKTNGKPFFVSSKVTSLDKNVPVDVPDNGLSNSAVQMKLQSKVSNEYTISPYIRDKEVPGNIFSTYQTSQNKIAKTSEHVEEDHCPKQPKPLKNFIVKPGFNVKGKLINTSETPPSKSHQGTSAKNPDLAMNDPRNVKDKKFSVSFFQAVKNNNLSYIKQALSQLEPLGRLAKYKIDSDSTDEEGSSLMHYAIWFKNEQLFYFLLSIKADFDKFNKDGITPLMLAALLPWKSAFSILSNIVRDINAVDRYGNTALHYAVVKENLDIVAILLQRPNVATDIRNKDGQTPIDISHPRSAIKLQEMLIAYKKEADKRAVDIEIFEDEHAGDDDIIASLQLRSRDKSRKPEHPKHSANSHRLILLSEEPQDCDKKGGRNKQFKSKEKKAQALQKFASSKNIMISDITATRVGKIDAKAKFASKLNMLELSDQASITKRNLPTPTNYGLPQSMSSKNLGFGCNKKSTANLLPGAKSKELPGNPKPLADKLASHKVLHPSNKEFLGNLFKKTSGDKPKNYVTFDQRPNVNRFRTEPDEAAFGDNLRFLKQKISNEVQRSKAFDKANMDIYKSVDYESFKKIKNGASTQIESGSDVARSKRVNLSSFNIHSIVGKGSFGQVFLVEKKHTNMFYAMKVLPKQRVFKDNLKRYAITERNVLSTINHPFIVKLHFAFQNKENLFLIMDYQPGGDLGEYLQDEGRFSERRARIYIAEIILAVEELHRYNIIFRDLKPENILLDAEGHAMLTDFGLSKENVHAVNKGAKSFCGSVAYLAPEMIKKTGHGKAMDWYLLGVVLYEMVTGIPPFYAETKEELFHNIQHTQLKIPETLSTDLQDLLQRLLEKDPTKRIIVEEIKTHPWFKEISWEDVAARKLKPPKPNIKRLKLNSIKDKGDFLDNKKADFFEIDGWTFIHNNLSPEKPEPQDF